MKIFLPLLLLAVATAFAGSPTASPTPDTAHEETVFLFENRKLSVLVPQLFSYNAGKDDRGLLHVRVADPKEKMSLDVMFLPDPEGRYASARARKEQIFELFQEYVDSSSEQGMQFAELEPRTGAGTYCVFTDKNLIGKSTLPPNEYLHLTAGVKTWPGVIAVFRLFSQDTTSADYQALMKMLRESVEEKPVPLR